MDTAKRMKLIKIIGKIEKNSEFSEKIGARNKSVLKVERKNNLTHNLKKNINVSKMLLLEEGKSIL